MLRTVWDVPGYHMYLYIMFHVVFIVSPASFPSKVGGASPCIQLHPLYWWGGAVAAPQTGLTSCQIRGIGYPRTVHGNPKMHLVYAYMYSICLCNYEIFVCYQYYALVLWSQIVTFHFPVNLTTAYYFNSPCVGVSNIIPLTTVWGVG